MKYEIKLSSQFKRDIRLAKKQNRNIDLLFDVVDRLSKDEKLDPKFRDHDLGGNWKGTRECHIESDWLLIYEKRKNVLVLMLYRAGTHAELFGK